MWVELVTTSKLFDSNIKANSPLKYCFVITLTVYVQLDNVLMSKIILN